MTSNSNNQFRFLSLPLELRLQIYNSIWPPSNVIRLYPQPISRNAREPSPPSPHHSRSPLSPLHVTSALRADALPIFYLHITIYLTQQPYLLHLLNSPSILSRIQHLALCKSSPRVGYDTWSAAARSHHLPQLLSSTPALRTLTIIQVPGHISWLESRKWRYYENEREKVRSDAAFWLRDVMNVPFELVVKRPDRDSVAERADAMQREEPTQIQRNHTWRLEIEALGGWKEEIGGTGKVRSRWRRIEGWEEYRVGIVEWEKRGPLARGGLDAEDEERKRNYAEKWKRQKSEIVAWRKKPPRGLDPRPRLEYSPSRY